MVIPFDLQRFVDAQDRVYEDVRFELVAGVKISHWMWFVFPQLVGLGRSTMTIKYAIASKEEAQAYWQHEVLGHRLRECAELALAIKGKTALQIFRTPDDLKFRSSLTLFSHAVSDGALFRRALVKHCDGFEDPKTMELLARS